MPNAEIGVSARGNPREDAYILCLSVFALQKVGIVQKAIHTLATFQGHLLGDIGLPKDTLGDAQKVRGGR
jgi:hypothetical protein